MSDDKDWRAPDAKPMTFDQMTARAQYEWDRAEKAEAEAQHHATALTEARAEIERLLATPLAIENTRLQKWIDLHRGDVMSLSGEVEQFRAERDAAESELSTLRARVREVVGPFSRLCEMHVDDDTKDSSGIIFPASRAVVQAGHLRAARQLNEDLK